MQLFHERHRHLLFLSIIGGVYLPSLQKIIPWKPVNSFLKGYAATVTIGFLMIATFALKYSIFQADNLISRITTFNNFNDYFLGFSRILLFNVLRNKAQALFDLWDVYFTGDGHDKTRKKYLEKLRRPYKKIIITCATLISVMCVSWAVDQFDNEDCDFSVPMGVPFQNQNPEYLIWASIYLILFLVYGPLSLAVDTLVMEPLIWIAAESIRLKESLEEILNTLKVTENGEIIREFNGFEYVANNMVELDRFYRIVDKKLKIWIIEHQKVLIFYRKTINVIHGPLIIQLLCTTTAICLFSVILAMGVFSINDIFMSLLVYLPAYTLFFIIVRYGDHVETHGGRIFHSAFATNWTIYPKHIQKNLHIIALRINYPMTINILKLYPLNSKTYLQIIQTAYSFYSFLRFLTSDETTD